MTRQIFDGKIYTYYSSSNSKRIAKARAKYLRKTENVHARILKDDRGVDVYHIFTRKK